MFDVRVEVEEVRGFCDLPMRPGNYFEVRGGRLIIPEGQYMCIWALQSLLPMIPLKQRTIAESNDWVNHTHRMMCPDPNGMVVYKFTRINHDHAMAETNPEQLPLPARMLVGPSCTGCGKCAQACTSASRERAQAPAQPRIWVTRTDGAPAAWTSAACARVACAPGAAGYAVNVCRQCGTASCVEACLRGALQKNARTGAIDLDQDRCTMCGACETACAFGAIRLQTGAVSGGGRVLVCDLCGGSPECVGQCPTGALRFGHGGTLLHGLRS